MTDDAGNTTVAAIISSVARVAFYVGGVGAIGYFIYAAIVGQFVLVHALLAVLALLVIRLVQVWYFVKAHAPTTNEPDRS